MKVTCPTCNGAGEIRMSRDPYNQAPSETCPTCHGAKEVDGPAPAYDVRCEAAASGKMGWAAHLGGLRVGETQPFVSGRSYRITVEDITNAAAGAGE